MNQTTFAKEGTLDNKWYEVDGTGLVVGRAAARIALILQGKNKPEYSANLDTGDHVVITNAEKVVFSGNKNDDKVYRYHTLFPGGLKERSYEWMIANHPDRIIKLAIERMLPKTKMGRKMIKKLHVYTGDSHNHQAQCPEALDLNVTRRDK
ncbi:MAG: 50S ribosomal protein L13 [Planctomycetes bacterium]|nr:50S ribosomal protein L13 [Planctomycetota bacterium]